MSKLQSSTDSFKKAWWRIPAGIRKPLVLMVGSAIITAGLVMLVFPGPGWAAIFLGFAILATEFAFAEKVRDWLIGLFRQLTATAKGQWKRFRKKHKR